MNDVHKFGVTELRTAYLRSDLTPAEVVDSYFNRIASYDDVLNCYTALDEKRARADAQLSCARVAASDLRPLEGVPIAIKANIAVKGLATTGGLAALRENWADEDAEAVKLLREAGAIVLGHVNMHEGALGGTTDNPHFGATHNPHKIGYTPGGSSGGSGAAVAAGLCAAALGTDTWGSIRIPAAYNGVYGLKPTYGLVSDIGLLPLLRRLDTIGPLARSVQDVALILEVLAPLTPAKAVIKVGTLDIADTADVETSVKKAYYAAVDAMHKIAGKVQGYNTGKIDLVRVRNAGFVEAAREMQAFFADTIQITPDGFSPKFMSHLNFAGRFERPALLANAERLNDVKEMLQNILSDADAILLPTTPQAAFRHGDGGPVSMGDFTSLANIAGLPAISIPSGSTDDGLPVAVQLIGRPKSERTLIELAERLDRLISGYAMPAGHRKSLSDTGCTGGDHKEKENT